MATEKAPAYQWYPKDAFSDAQMRVMSYEQQGMYRALLDHQWLEGSIPADPDEIGLLLGVDGPAMARLWPRIAVKFVSVEIDGAPRLQNARLERCRTEQLEWRENLSQNGQLGAAKRWAGNGRANGGAIAEPSGGHGLANGQTMPLQSASASASAPSSAIGKIGVQPDALRVLWNATVKRLPQAQKLTDGRRRHATARLQEEPDLEAWREVFARLDASDFAAGVDGGWRADFDFAIKPDTATKIREGKYDNRGKPPPMMGAGRTAGNVAALQAVLGRERGPDVVERERERPVLQAVGGLGRNDG